MVIILQFYVLSRKTASVHSLLIMTCSSQRLVGTDCGVVSDKINITKETVAQWTLKNYSSP